MFEGSGYVLKGRRLSETKLWLKVVLAAVNTTTTTTASERVHGQRRLYEFVEADIIHAHTHTQIRNQRHYDTQPRHGSAAVASREDREVIT